MKNTTIWMITLLLVSLIATGAMAASPEWVAVKTDTPPTINADFSDEAWQSANEFVLDKALVETAGTVIWRGGAPTQLNNSGRFYLLWDQDFLYLYAKVQDHDVFTGRELGQPLNNGTDGLQIVMHPTTVRWIIDITPGQLNEDTPLMWEHWQVLGNILDVDVASKITEEGYEIEVAFPWSLFNATEQIKAGYQFPFGMIIQEHQDNYLMMDFGQGDRVIGNASRWNTLTLGE